MNSILGLSTTKEFFFVVGSRHCGLCFPAHVFLSSQTIPSNSCPDYWVVFASLLVWRDFCHISTFFAATMYAIIGFAPSAYAPSGYTPNGLPYVNSGNMLYNSCPNISGFVLCAQQKTFEIQFIISSF